MLGVTSSAYAVEVAFFRQYTPSGQLVVYEAGGEFAHVALSYQGKWLHAHPYGGVQLSHHIYEIGFLDYVILENKNTPEPTDMFVHTQLQKGFDIFAQWTDAGKTYCSKLIAEFFGIQPRTMYFISKDWVGHNPPRGQLGISPDDLFKELIGKKGFQMKPETGAQGAVKTHDRLLTKAAPRSPQKRKCVGYLTSQ
ncbi:MAG: hypothetical protein M9899_02220 [Bdellovibrionaceae bacterium]|nr:hypothetical protein [Pseudobdellovibrionaceae bacterium]